MKTFSVLTISVLCSICRAEYLDKLNIIGNEHTKVHIIERELCHPIPGEYDSTLALEDRNRIYNLGLFSTVEIEQIDSSYTIFLVETFRFIPIPIVDHNEAQGWSYGGGIAFLNFRGMNQKLTLGAIIGEENTYFFDFNDPWITEDHVSLYGSVYQFSTKNPFYSYNYKEKGFSIGTGFYKNKYHKFNIEMGIEYPTIDTSEINVMILEKYENIPLNYNYFRGKLTYRYDTRDIYLDPTSGELITLLLKPKVSFGQSENYHIFLFKYLKYLKISDGYLNPVLSFNTTFLFQKSKLFPIFAYQYLGGEDFVRGYSPLPEENPVEISHLIEGYNIYYNSIQMQHTLVPKKDFHKVELGIDMIYFIDLGISANNISSFKLKNTIFGFGFGFRFFVSGAGVLGIDFGFNPYSHYDQPFIHLSDGQ